MRVSARSVIREAHRAPRGPWVIDKREEDRFHRSQAGIRTFSGRRFMQYCVDVIGFLSLGIQSAKELVVTAEYLKMKPMLVLIGHVSPDSLDPVMPMAMRAVRCNCRPGDSPGSISCSFLCDLSASRARSCQAPLREPSFLTDRKLQTDFPSILHLRTVVCSKHELLLPDGHDLLSRVYVSRTHVFWREREEITKPIG
jgi:hypothetical protein